LKNQDISPFAGCISQAGTQDNNLTLSLIGLPDDSQSSHRMGCRKAPNRIRAAYNGECFNATTEFGVDLSESVVDCGNLTAGQSWQQTADRYHQYAEQLFKERKVPFFLGGDHAVTVPIMRATAVIKQPIYVVQIDAHPDLYPEFGGSRTSHACTAARLLEMEHVARITQVGVRTLNQVQAEFSRRHRDRLAIIGANDMSDSVDFSSIPSDGLVYVTLDLDGLDPAFAPGVSHPVPGGMTTRQALNLIQTLPGRLIGMDAVEVNPDLDVNDQTAIVAARLLHEAMGKAITQKNSTHIAKPLPD
jgi:agmatinase